MRLLSLLLALPLAACATDVRAPSTPPSTAPIQASFDAAAVRQQAESLASGLDINGAQKDDLMARLDALLADADFEARARTSPVRAVGAYQMGEGGFVVKIGRGAGRIVTADSTAPQPFVLDVQGAGAMVGGKSSTGIVLALGNESAASLEGKYGGAETSATAIDESTGAVRLEHRNRHHTLYLVAIGEGLQANAGADSLQFSFGTAK